MIEKLTSVYGREAARLVIYLAAAMRVARMVSGERGPFDVFARWQTWLMNIFPPQANQAMWTSSPLHWVPAGFQCVKCVGFWSALAALLAWRLKSNKLNAVALWFAASLVVGR